MTRIPINKIIDFSVVDGVGNRTSIFVQGCNLNCIFCHNPETISLCNHCGACVAGCPAAALKKEDGKVVWNAALCVECDACLKNCPNHASPRVTWMTVEELVARVSKNIPFIRGVTVSGGECTLYHNQLAELFRQLSAKGLSCFLDHNGTFDFRQNPELLAASSGVLYDAKATGEVAQKAVTGELLPKMLPGLVYLLGQNKLAEVRTVIAEDARFESRKTVEAVAELMAEQGGADIPYKLLAFRPFGVRQKYRSIKPPGKAFQQELLEAAQSKGLTNVSVIS